MGLIAFTSVIGSVSNADEFPIPVTGEEIPEFQSLDRIVVNFMKLIDASSGSLAVSRDGELLHSRGFGWKDNRRRQVTQPDTLFRIASVSKPITAALTKKTIEEGKLKPDAKVFEIISTKTGEIQFRDNRLSQITIQHLLDHKGGWDSKNSFDPMFRERQIQQTLRVRGKLGPWHVVQFMTQQPLQFDPGTKSVYSNFGFCLLGRVLEVAHNQPYYNCLEESILEPLEIEDIKLAKSSSRNRDPKEVWYPINDNALAIEIMDAHGGLIASSPALCKFMDHYWISGEPRQPNHKFIYAFFGSLPGTTAYVKQSLEGWNVAVLINNRRNDKFGEDNDLLAKQIDVALKTLKQPGK
jgi:CubicO group peptidase (beta-lactamase class C family)